MHVVHCHTPSGRLSHASTSSRSLPRGSSSSRSAAASAAGPTKPVAGAPTGQADRQIPHSMQSSRRTNASCSAGGCAVGSDLADADDRVLVGEALVERAHVDDDVGARRQVGERLDADLTLVVGERAHAGQLLAAVDAHAAGAARGVHAGMAQRQRAVAVQLDPAQRLDQRRVRSDRHVELVEVPVRLPAVGAVHAQAAGLAAPVLTAGLLGHGHGSAPHAAMAA